jgi:hypothetical protein
LALLEASGARFAASDPCIGDGCAFGKITEDEHALRYGIELDAYRAEQARAATHQVIHGNALDVHCSIESLSLLYLIPVISLSAVKAGMRGWSRSFWSTATAG